MNLVLRSRNGYPTPYVSRSPVFDRSVANLIDGLFDDFLAPRQLGSQEPAVSSPRIEVIENEKAYEVRAELPGVTKENVRLSVDGQVVSIEAEVKRAEERKEGETVLHSERVVSKFARSFTLPVELDEAGAAAKLELGVLTLTLPKKAQKQPTQIAIQ
jgi:HSP20 family protein